MGRASSARGFLENIRPPKKPKICQDVPLHQVLRHIYEALNIDENKNQSHILPVNRETNVLSLVTS